MNLPDMTDVAYTEYLLRQGPVTNVEIQSRSYADRGRGLHVNNRISDIRLRMKASGEGTVRATPLGRSGRTNVWRYELDTNLQLFDVA